MLWILAALTCILGLVGLLIVASHYSSGHTDYDLGSVSARWINQHRTDS
jgi:hypothetical protein